MKKVIFTILLLLTVTYSVFAQTPKLEIQLGHSSYIECLEITDNQKYLLSSSALDNAIIIWDYYNGNIIKTITNVDIGGIRYFYILTDSTILIQNEAFNFIQYNIVQDKIEDTIKYGIDIYYSSITYKREFLIVRQLNSNKIDIIDIKNRSVANTIDVMYHGYPFVLSQSENILAIYYENRISIWNLEKNEEIFNLNNLPSKVLGVTFVQNSNNLIYLDQNYIYLIDYTKNEILKQVKRQCDYCEFESSIETSPNGEYIYQIINNEVLWIRGTKDLEKISVIQNRDSTHQLHWISFTRDSKDLIICYNDGLIKRCNILDDNKTILYKGTGFKLEPVSIIQGNKLYFLSSDKYIYEWSLFKGYKRINDLYCELKKESWMSSLHVLLSIDKETGILYNVVFTMSAEQVQNNYKYKFYDNDTIKIINFKENNFLKNLRLYGKENSFITASISKDGNRIYTCNMDGTIGEWDINNDKLLKTYDNKSYVNNIKFSNDGKYFLTVDDKNDLKIWEINKTNFIKKISGVNTKASFTNKPNIIIYQDTNDALILYDIEMSKVINYLAFKEELKRIKLINNYKEILITLENENFIILELDSFNIVRRFNNKEHNKSETQYSKEDKYFFTNTLNSNINTISGITKIWDVEEGKVLCSLIGIDSVNWAVVTPEGLFDCSPNAMKKMHWVVGMETIQLEQLKERYYEPGLLSKLMGYNTEPIKNAFKFKDVKLFPSIDLIPPTEQNKNLIINLTNRGGGIGKVRVLINGKEFASDARSYNEFNPEENKLSIKIDISKSIFIIPDKENKIEVIAFNEEGYLSSTPKTIYYTPNSTPDNESPNLYAVIIGVSKYEGDMLKLKYSSKDAEDFESALRIGAYNLFGKEKTNIISLTSNKQNSIDLPTKENITRAFESLKNIKQKDILVVYLAGHGINIGSGSENEDFYYLTKEAKSGNLDDPEIRNQCTISSNELTELILMIPALKQVMILDVCGSGRIIDKLSEKRDIPSGQIRAFERMKDRTGLHIVSGCTADAVSYETSKYGQGLLTYSLLMGIKGAALRDNEYVDIRKLFEFAANEVPKLAKNIGGIQQPRIFGNESFDIGIINQESKDKIPLSVERPLVLQTNFQDAYLFYDHLGITQKVNLQLRDFSVERGKESKLVYVDANEFPDAYTVVGRYKTDKDEIKVNIKVFKSGKEVTSFSLNGETKYIDIIIQKIISKLEELN